jgi:GTP-binding protein Era
VYDFNAVIPLSALHGLNLHLIKKFIEDHLPEHPPYYPEDQLSDRNDRFFVSEFIRKHILIQFSKEIPYSVEVVVDDYQESDKIDRIRATIYVERESQKGILIGKGGSALKKLGEASRTEIEEYLDKKIFLGLTIKVRDNWRSDDRMLTYFGYKS